MKFERYTPTERLKPYIKGFAVSEMDAETEYKVLPSCGLVIGFQYRGRLSTIKEGREIALAPSGITGISDGYAIFKNSPYIGTILVFFSELGFTHFTSHPANELWNLSLSLDNIFTKADIGEAEEKLALAHTDRERIRIVERFLLKHLKPDRSDELIAEAVRLIQERKGVIPIQELHKRLFISQSPFEKRFRKLVGTTPKKFASLVRFRAVLNALDKAKSLTDLGYETGFFDQAHFIRDFRRHTGETPEQYKRRL